jgi:hypothetical protein
MLAFSPHVDRHVGHAVDRLSDDRQGEYSRRPTTDYTQHLPIGSDHSRRRQLVVAVGMETQLLRVGEGGVSVRKGAAWWLSTRERDGKFETTLKAVVNPDMVEE